MAILLAVWTTPAFRSKDAREGVEAFLNQRKANFVMYDFNNQEVQDESAYEDHRGMFFCSVCE